MSVTDASSVSSGELDSGNLAKVVQGARVGGETARVPSAGVSGAGSRLIHLMDLFRVIAVRQGGHCGHSAHAAVAELDLHPADSAVDGPALRRR